MLELVILYGSSNTTFSFGKDFVIFMEKLVLFVYNTSRLFERGVLDENYVNQCWK